jgi:hypothetical protein
MEAQPGQAEAAKVQIADLKQELAASQVSAIRNVPVIPCSMVEVKL